MKPELVREKPLLDLPSFVRGADKSNHFSVGLAKFCVRIGNMVVCPGDCEACPLICQENPPVTYTRCGRCDWLAYGRLDALLIAEGIHRRIHEDPDSPSRLRALWSRTSRAEDGLSLVFK